MHALIVGSCHVGKSTLIQRVIAQVGRPVFGYETIKELALAVPGKGDPVYIYEAGLPRVQTSENLAGYCADRCFTSNYEVFNRFAPKLLQPVPQEAIILLDEIGKMESAAEAFRNAILSLLDGEIPVIAAVKDRDTPFLNTVRAHPHCRCFYITEENRNELYGEVLSFMKEALTVYSPNT